MPAYMNRTTKQIKRGGSDVHPSAVWSRFQTLADGAALQAVVSYFRTVDGTSDEPREMTSTEKDTAGPLASHKVVKHQLVDGKTRELIGAGHEYPASSGDYVSTSAQAQASWGQRFACRVDLTYPLEVMLQDESGVLSLADQAALETFYDSYVSAIQGHIASGLDLKVSVSEATTAAAVDAVSDTR